MTVAAHLKSLYIEILARCNKRCIYCYNGDILSNADLIPLSMLRTVIAEAKKEGVMSITFSGGEPLMHPDIASIMAFCAEQELHTTVISNLTLLTPALADAFAASNTALQITADSGNAAVHDASRGSGTFEAQKNSLALLREHGYKGAITLRSNIYHANCSKENIASVFALAREEGITSINFALAHNTPLFKESISDEALKEEIAQWVIDTAKDFEGITAEFPEAAPNLGCPLLSESNDMDCGFRIAPDGNVFPCQLFFEPQFALGNIYHEHMAEIIEGEKLQRLLSLLRMRKHYISECQSCVCQSMCSAGCPATAFLNTGNIFHPAGPCARRKKTYRAVLNEAFKKTASARPDSLG